MELYTITFVQIYSQIGILSVWVKCRFTEPTNYWNFIETIWVHYFLKNRISNTYMKTRVYILQKKLLALGKVYLHFLIVFCWTCETFVHILVNKVNTLVVFVVVCRKSRPTAYYSQLFSCNTDQLKCGKYHSVGGCSRLFTYSSYNLYLELNETPAFHIRKCFQNTREALEI